MSNKVHVAIALLILLGITACGSDSEGSEPSSDSRATGAQSSDAQSSDAQAASATTTDQSGSSGTQVEASAGEGIDPAAMPPADTRSNSSDGSDLGTGEVTMVMATGGSYIFSTSDFGVFTAGQCRDIVGLLIVQMELTHINGEPAPAGAGKFELDLYAEGLRSRDALTVHLPDGQLWAGAAGPAIDTPEVTITRGEGLNAGGTQKFVSISGEESTAVINVVCE